MAAAASGNESERGDDYSNEVEEVKENEEGMREERSADTDECMEERKEEDSGGSEDSLSSSSESDNIISTKTPQTRKRQREELKRK